MKPQEFLEWQWFAPEDALENTVDFKFAQYKRVFAAFVEYLSKPSKH